MKRRRAPRAPLAGADRARELLALLRAMTAVWRFNPDPSAAPDPRAERLAAWGIGVLVLGGAIGTYLVVVGGVSPLLADEPAGGQADHERDHDHGRPERSGRDHGPGTGGGQRDPDADPLPDAPGQPTADHDAGDDPCGGHGAVDRPAGDHRTGHDHASAAVAAVARTDYDRPRLTRPTRPTPADRSSAPAGASSPVVIALTRPPDSRLRAMDTKVADPMHGALLGGRYRVMGLLARGGMATVYQARDERLDRSVAVKIIHPDHAKDQEFLDRLADEAKTVARLGHPNIVAVFDQGTHEGTPYVVMEYVRGRTLREVLDDRRRLDPAESLAVLEQMLAALAVAHRAGLVHRDVKPENVLVAPPPNGSGDLVDSVVKVADFGLAHQVEVGQRGSRGQLLATAEYVAPELVADGRADPRADVYSSGICLFEMLTGRVPFDGARPADVAWQHVDQDVPPPSRIVPGLPKLFDDIVARSTSRDPAGRPRDAAAMLAEIQTAREDLGALAGPTRALAHPTVVVPAVRDGDKRPSWARLPAPRRSNPERPIGARHGGNDVTGPQRAVQILPTPVLGAARSARNWFAGIARTNRGRQQLTAVIVLLGIVLVAGGWWLGFGRYTTAPSFIGLTKENAQVEASRLGFTIALGTGIYSEQVPQDTVITQNPAPGGKVVKGGEVTLVLSLGTERYPVPDVSGQALDFAKSQLTKVKLVPEEVDGFSDTLPVGYVVGTDPQANTLAPPGSVVKVIVARGKYPVHVPTVVGKQLPEAEAELRAAGFAVEVTRIDDKTKPRDFVLEQNPTGGQGMTSAQGQTVKLVVANGPPGPPMPSVVSMNCAQAVSQLQGMGLQVQANGNDVERFFWSVQTQSPNPGDPVQPGQTVTLQCG